MVSDFPRIPTVTGPGPHARSLCQQPFPCISSFRAKLLSCKALFNFAQGSKTICCVASSYQVQHCSRKLEFIPGGDRQ